MLHNSIKTIDETNDKYYNFISFVKEGIFVERITIEEFKNQSNIETINSIMQMNNGYVTSKELSNLGIHRMYLNIMKEKGMIEKVGNGIYIDSSKIEDNYFVFSLELPNIVYSHMTALYFHGLSIKAPNDKYDITVPNNYFNYKIKNHNVFYVNRDIYELGLMQVILQWVIK